MLIGYLHHSIVTQAWRFSSQHSAHRPTERVSARFE